MGITYEIERRTPRSSQGMTPRRMTWTGAVSVHTCENTPDQILPDGGAEAVTDYVFSRTDAGSYATIVDSDSIKRLFPPRDWETWSVAARDKYGQRHNSYTASISMAYKALWWGRNPDYEARMIDRCGEGLAEILLIWAQGDSVLASRAVRWLTPDQVADGEAGFFEHGLVQPADRNDAWSTHIDRASLRDRLSTATLHYLGVPQATEQRKVPGKMLFSLRKDDGKIEDFALFGGKPFHRWQQSQNGIYSPWQPMFSNTNLLLGPINDPGAFDNISAASNADGRLECTAFHSLYGPFGVFKCWQGSDRRWGPWVRV